MNDLLGSVKVSGFFLFPPQFLVVFYKGKIQQVMRCLEATLANVNAFLPATFRCFTSQGHTRSPGWKAFK
jgi:hypothetical protein